MPKERLPIILDFSDEDEPEDFIMPFGKHRDEKLGAIPNNYLRWAIGEFDEKRYPDLVSKMNRVLNEREKYGEHIEDEYELEREGNLNSGHKF